MKYIIHRGFVLLMILPVFLMTACKSKEERVQEKAIAHMEELYGEDFEMVSFSYNKHYSHYEVGVQTEKTKKGCYATEITYESDKKIADNYYSRLYCVEMTEAFEKALDLEGEKYVFSHFLVDQKTPMGMGMSYEEMIDFNLRDTALEVELYYVGREEEPLEIMESLVSTLNQLEQEDVKVDFHLVTEEDIADLAYFVPNHHAIYEGSDLVTDYRHLMRIHKKDGEITIITDKHRWDEEHEWFIERLEKDLSDNNIPYSSV